MSAQASVPTKRKYGGKAKLNLSLSEEAREILMRISQEYGISASAVVNLLVEKNKNLKVTIHCED